MPCHYYPHSAEPAYVQFSLTHELMIVAFNMSLIPQWRALDQETQTRFTFHRGVQYIMSNFLLSPGHILWAYEKTLNLGFEGPSRWGNTRGRWMSFFVYKPTASIRRIIMGWWHSCVFCIPQPTSLPNTDETACLSPFPIVLFFQQRLRWLTGLGTPGGWLLKEPLCPASCIFFYCCCASSSLFMSVLCKPYSGCSRLLRPSEVE